MLRAQMMAEEKFSSMARQMGRWMDNVLGKGFHKFCPGEAWAPAVNLYEDQKCYCIVADLAGLQVEEIDLRTQQGLMILSGNRQTPSVPESLGSVRVHLMEIDHGPFCRSIELPEDADVDSVKACYRGGYLWMWIGKKA